MAWGDSTRAGDDRGAVLIEAAFVFPIVMMIFFGIIEFGLAFKDYLSAANGTLSGARVATTAGDDAMADYDILQAIARNADLIPTDQILSIVIFEATGPNDTLPTQCSGGSSSPGRCNVYTGADLTRPESDFGCDETTDLDLSWCPGDRKVNSTTATGGPPDYVGIYMRVNHPYVTGLFGATITITDTTIMRIEPRQL